MLLRSVSAALVLGMALTACTGEVAADSTGEEIYAQLCAACHGEALEGGVGPPLGEGTPVVTQPDEYYVQTITRGKGRMPSFQELSDEQVQRLVAFIRDRQASTAQRE
jgi:mono/diheme cytochrome c family protein